MAKQKEDDKQKVAAPESKVDVLANWIYRIQSWIVKFLRLCIVISFLQKNFNFNFLWSSSNDSTQVINVNEYNNGLQDDYLDDFFRRRNQIPIGHPHHPSMGQLGGGAANSNTVGGSGSPNNHHHQQNLHGMININTDVNGDPVIDLTPFLNSGYNFKIRTNDAGTDSKQIEIKSFGCQENGIQEFEIPASMIGTQGITLEVPTTMATSGNDRKH